ncbi:helix-turn-helix transcriptional regulator [Undibacterium sp. MH2W]|uniref:helix-turn-helix transcriptional regulator n=1 Tax=Undibacterium sp. MH2W TaxID=3413044 RepID=UPI003BF342CF
MSETVLRQIECLKLLSKERTRTANEIHKALEDRGFKTSKRTVERDLQMLSARVGIVADEEQKPFGWKFNKDVALSLMPGLSETEALSFLLLKQFASRLLPSSIEEDLAFYFNSAAKSLSENISASAVRAWPNKVRTVETNLVLEKPSNDPAVRKEVYNALFRSKQVELTYRPAGKLEARTYAAINVLGLIEHGAVIYVVANFKGYDNVRLLALHRIHHVKVLDTPTVSPVGFDLDHYIARDGMGFGGDGNEISLVLRFYDRAGYPFLETALSKDQTFSIVSEDIIEISATVQNTVRLHRWLRSHGASVEVLAPKTLRATMKQALVDACDRYKD